MRVQLIGEPFGRQLNPGDEFRVMARDFIMIRDDGYIVVQPEWDGTSGGRTNGASIPWLFQILPRIGSPLAGKNPWWSCHHDGGYRGPNGGAYVFDVRVIPANQWCIFADDWATHKGGEFEVTQWPRRKWWDQGMLAAMKCETVDEPAWKCRIAYRLVRVGGWLPWRRARRG